MLLAAEKLGRNLKLELGVDEREVGDRAGLDLDGDKARDLARVHAHDLDEALPRHLAGRDEVREHERKARLEANDSERGDLKLALLLVQGMRRVVGDDAVDRAVGDAGTKRGGVLGRAQRRIHLEVRVVSVVERGLVEEQVVRADLGRDGQSLRLGRADELHAVRRRDVADVQGAAREAAQLDVTCDLDLLAGGRPAGQAQARAGTALVHHAMLREGADLAVAGDGAVELAHVVHDGAKHAGALDAMSVIREHAGALGDHIANLGQRLALLATRAGADGADVNEAAGVALGDLVADTLARVDDRVGVGHRGHVREATGSGGSGARLDGLLVLEAGVAEVDVDVGQAGNEVLAVGLDDLGTLGGLDALANPGDALALDEHVHDTVETNLGVNDVGALNQQHSLLLQAAGTFRPCGCRGPRRPVGSRTSSGRRRGWSRSPCRGSSGPGA